MENLAAQEKNHSDTEMQIPNINDFSLLLRCFLAIENT